jgi:alkaline phosphatase D
MPFERLVAGPRDVLAPLYETDDFGGWQQKYKPGSLIHGPMVGSVTDSGASFWIRTAQESKFAVRVYPMDGDFPLAISRLAMTTIANDLTGVAVVEGLEPGTRYRYAIEIDSSLYVMDKPTFRTSPKQHSAAEFSVGFGGGAGYVPEWEYMWDTISKADPHAFLMLGDNVYIDDPEHDLTMKYCYYRRQSRPEWRRFTSSQRLRAWAGNRSAVMEASRVERFSAELGESGVRRWRKTTRLLVRLLHRRRPLHHARRSLLPNSRT